MAKTGVKVLWVLVAAWTLGACAVLCLTGTAVDGWLDRGGPDPFGTTALTEQARAQAREQARAFADVTERQLIESWPTDSAALREIVERSDVFLLLVDVAADATVTIDFIASGATGAGWNNASAYVCARAVAGPSTRMTLTDGDCARYCPDMFAAGPPPGWPSREPGLPRCPWGVDRSELVPLKE